MNWHRKARKTTLAINELIRWAAAVPATYWYVAPLRDQAKKIVWDDPNMLEKYVPPEIWSKRNSSELSIRFPNGSVLYVLGARDPESLRGPNPLGVVLDEFGDMWGDVWTSVVQPIMLAHRGRGWCWFVGTPKGKNEFYNKAEYARVSGDKNWSYFVLPASVSGIIPEEQLQEARRTMPAAMYDQELEVAFVDSATQVFRRVKENLYEPSTYAPDLKHKFQLGVDLAKYQDWTVITSFDLNTFIVHPQDRFNQIDWNLQKARIQAAYYRYNRPRTVMDATGVGDPIVEDLQHAGLQNIEPFKFTETSRKELLDNLSILIEQDKIKLPKEEGLLSELESFRYVMTGERGKIKMEVPAGMTDDRVMSLALAVWGAKDKEPIRRDPSERPVARPKSYFQRNYR